LAEPIYCIDTSSILEWYVRTYPPTILPKLPERIETLIANGRMRAPRAVLDEIRAGDDCHNWAKSQNDLFLEEALEVQTIVKQLMSVHHNPSKPMKGINGADPFVIAMAKHGGPNWVVVCNEHQGSEESRKIPFVCKTEGVRCINLQQLILNEGWKFS
jgi:Domain of unknown function (DUF4411)